MAASGASALFVFTPVGPTPVLMLRIQLAWKYRAEETLIRYGSLDAQVEFTSCPLSYCGVLRFRPCIVPHLLPVSHQIIRNSSYDGLDPFIHLRLCIESVVVDDDTAVIVEQVIACDACYFAIPRAIASNIAGEMAVPSSDVLAYSPDGACAASKKSAAMEKLTALIVA
ncbi:hypothetical protein ANO11243_092710 [Dothideomycetidae sp. 11243]|nr:hypothetical protein ANO11243_092710 [fungal sp. No.11243]